MNADDRASRFYEQWMTWKNPMRWELQLEGDFYPDVESIHQTVIAICKGAFRVVVAGEYKRHPDDNDSTHTPSGRAVATLNWEGWTRRGNWEIISIDTEQPACPERPTTDQLLDQAEYKEEI